LFTIENVFGFFCKIRWLIYDNWWGAVSVTLEQLQKKEDGVQDGGKS
jgi:hypothetical protein